jgi:sugar phosphate isomerase/epimerase
LKLGCNTVVFAGHPAEQAVQWVAWAGFAGVEWAAIPGMAEHLSAARPDEARALVARARDLGLETPACEAATNLFDEGARERLYRTFELCGQLGIRVVTTGSSGASRPESLEQFLQVAREVARHAEDSGVVWACKPHVGSAVYSTETALTLVREVPSRALGINFDPTHLQRVGEDPVAAVRRLGPHLRHVHIRDYSSPDTRIGPPELQVPGRGLVDLTGVFRALSDVGYAGWADLEIIGAGGWDPVRQMAIAAASCGYLQRLVREVAP